MLLKNKHNYAVDNIHKSRPESAPDDNRTAVSSDFRRYDVSAGTCY